MKENSYRDDFDSVLSLKENKKGIYHLLKTEFERKIPIGISHCTEEIIFYLIRKQRQLCLEDSFTLFYPLKQYFVKWNCDGTSRETRGPMKEKTETKNNCRQTLYTQL